MDARLVAWARAVKSRRTPAQRHLPALWLFTDERRLPNPLPAVAALPRGLAGVVLRHDHDPRRAALGHAMARLCRARHLALVVAGDLRLAAALGAGVHLRGGRWPAPQRPPRGLITSSAHTAAELHRAWHTGAQLAFLSPAFATASHPGAAGLGPARWSCLARSARLPVAALGGIDHHTVRRLPTHLCVAVGAIGALALPAPVRRAAMLR